MDDASLTSWLALQAIDGVGDRTLLKLIHAFGAPDTVLGATRGDLISRRLQS